MAKRKIVWTERANFERRDTLDYWIRRNKSKTYSIKLNKLFKVALKNISENPAAARKTDFDDNVRVKIVRDYLLFYRFNDTEIKVLSVWSGHRNENKINDEYI